MDAVQDAVAQGDEHPWACIKLMIVGRGAAGKTSLVRSLLGQTPVLEHDSTEVASISRTRTQDWQALFGDHSDFDEQVRFAASQRVHGSLSDSATQASPASQSVQPTSSVETVVQAPHPSQSAQSTSSGGATTFRPGEGASAASATFTHASPVSSAPTVSPSAYHNPAPSDSQPILVAPEEVARRFRLRAEDTTLLQSAAPERDVSFSIWDYGGQRVFYALHHIFLTSKGLYVVVFDMRELLDVDKLKDKLTPQELAGLATRDESLWFVRFWLNSIKLHAPDASVVLVGTHKDQVDDLEEVDDVLRAAGVVRPDCRLVLPENDLLFFAVDNCSPDVNRAEALRKAVTETATQLDHAHDKVPLAWLKIREDLVESKEPFVPIEEVLAMGATLGQSQTDVRKMLAYFHDVGVVVYLSGSETLERVVVIEPQWLLDKLARVIADDLHARKLSLLAWLWGEEEVDYLIEFMEANMLICPWKFDVESDEGPFFLVPALLSLTRHIVGTSQFQRDGDAVPKVKALPLLGPNVDKHIFLSHKQSTGGDTAGMLKVKLENRGVKVWFDQSYTHTLHHDAMLDGVRRSQMYLLVLTKDVFSSDAVKNELRCAIEAGKQIVLVHESETHRVSFAPFHEYTETVPLFCKDLFTRTESLPIRRKWYEEDTFFSELLRRCNLSVSSGVGKQGFDDPMGESPAVLDFSECDVLSGMCPCL
ncbi:Leucine-rich repeat serine/threonine-protein kinase 1 [Hondaea fermentalgiana]|uniref:non-specific serine/threonine protein kinase n=1 Tax=Hondaea fermentalgiana TaxID=2315210 RepID=A0A2R5GVC4_9STRA|nr:Leucine-rich repeat serine/threonine-protein kinase 1 [Hondaea fermentalgiana]|eukprot:GBG34515.1 Leucine-rich repeat serine/threonine-protein kinase 1 [Hondaea fermentalgiana]